MTQARWCLFLDDERTPKTRTDWVIARSVADAISLIKKNGCPFLISFDHDLGHQVPTGHDFAKWLVDQDQDQKISFPQDFSFEVHSANPAGRDNILSLMNSYLKFRGKR